MKLNSEDAVKKALGIDSFRELSKEKMLAFAAAMPDMATEVRLKLLEQLPAFQKFAQEAVNVVERTFDKTMHSNDASESKVQDAFADVRDALKTDLKRDDISEEHRKLLYDKLMETGQAQSEKDTEGKKFKAEPADSTRNAVLKMAGIAVVAAVVFAGGKIMIGQDLDGDAEAS